MSPGSPFRRRRHSRARTAGSTSPGSRRTSSPSSSTSPATGSAWTGSPTTGTRYGSTTSTFDFDYHVRHTSLPRPGPTSNCGTSAGRIVSTPLDRAKPLWELWVVEGLEDDRFALIAKIHHCMIDGISGVDLTTILLNVIPSSDIEEAPEWKPRPAPTPTQLAVAESARATRRLIDRLTHFSEAVREGRDLADRTMDKSAAALFSLRSGWLTTSDRTPLNPDIGPNRRFDLDRYPPRATSRRSSQPRRVGQRCHPRDSCRGNPQFPHRGEGYDLAGTEFRVMNPVSTRRADQRGAWAIRSRCG